MLAHFENLNLTPLLKDLNMSHVLLLYLLDSNALARLLVLSKLDQAKLSFTERFIEGIKLEHIRVAHSLLQLIDPSSLVILFWEEHQTRLVWRNDELYRVEVLRLWLLFCPTLLLLSFRVLWWLVTRATASRFPTVVRFPRSASGRFRFFRDFVHGYFF